MRIPQPIVHTAKFILAGFAAVFASTLPAQAQSGCDPEFADNARTVSVTGIEIGAGERAREDFTILVRNPGSESCAAFLRVARRFPAISQDDLPIRLSSSGRLLEILPNLSTVGAIGDDLLIPNIPTTSNGRALPFRLGFPTEWGLQAGLYSQEFVLSLHDQTGALLDTMVLVVRIDVPPAVALRIVGASGNSPIKRINLGILDPDAINRSDPFGLRIWSTSPYRVEFQSENLGSLRHNNGEGEIPYSLLMSGSEVNLEGTNVRVFTEHTSSLGDLHPLRVLVQPFFAEAGRYSDRVEVSVSAI